MNSLKSKNRKPTHPGAILREDVLPELDITQTQLANSLKVSRRTISEIIHERRPLTPDMTRGDTTLTAVLLDRLLHHEHIMPIAGESYRLKNQRAAGTVRGK